MMKCNIPTIFDTEQSREWTQATYNEGNSSIALRMGFAGMWNKEDVSGGRDVGRGCGRKVREARNWDLVVL